MRYVKFGTYTGEENMQIDSDLLDEAIETQAQEPVFRLYAWKPRCITLGRNQKDDFIKANGVKEDVVRRLTGGRALLHDDEITYSYVTPISIIPEGETISASYKYISGMSDQYAIRRYMDIFIPKPLAEQSNDDALFRRIQDEIR